MKNVLLIHGFTGIPKIFNYFKKELENKGYNVILPNFPLMEDISQNNYKIGKYISLAGFSKSYYNEGKDVLNEKVKLTQNYTGFNIEGTFDDLYELYNSISFFIGTEECPDIIEEDMRLHILGFLYDLRHAYQGSRNIKSVDNGLSEEQKEYYGIGKSIKKDILYGFNYVVPELITDILLFKHFAKTHKINEYDTNYNNVMTFYSKVINALKENLTENQLKRIRKNLSETVISTKYWLRQWFMIVSINYITMTKKKRQKEMMHIIESIYDSYLYDKYYEVKKEVEQFAKENDMSVTEIEYGEYPEEIEW